MNLKIIRKENGFSQEKLSKIIGVSRSTIAMWETGGSQPDNDSLKRLAEALNVSTDAILGHNIKTQDKTIIKVPVYGVIPAGVPIEAIEDILDYEELDATRYSEKEYFALRIKGESMQPNYLDSDTVIFEKTETCETGDDCAVLVNGNDSTFKRVERSANGIVLKPLNPSYETLFFTNEDILQVPVRIIGVAIELRRKTK